MKVVLRTRSGILALSFFSKLVVCSLGGLFMLSSVRLLICCNGISIYLHTCTEQDQQADDRAWAHDRGHAHSPDYAGLALQRSTVHV